MLEKILMMQNKVLIKEIFTSIQGEGIYIGVNQLFIRFIHCNLNCSFCDTDFSSNPKEYDITELAKFVNSFKNIHSVSLTGGEPLIETDFLINFLSLVHHKIYLETNGILYDNLAKIKDKIDIISMDIKLPSCSNNKNLFNEHEKFIKIAKEKELFIKIVFDEKINNDEILKSCELGKKYSVPIVLQPKMDKDKINMQIKFINSVYYKFIENYQNIRLIPQVHKFMNIK